MRLQRRTECWRLSPYWLLVWTSALLFSFMASVLPCFSFSPSSDDCWGWVRCCSLCFSTILSCQKFHRSLCPTCLYSLPLLDLDIVYPFVVTLHVCLLLCIQSFLVLWCTPEYFLSALITGCAFVHAFISNQPTFSDFASFHRSHVARRLRA
ncbi:unnamed protein product [Scytosiphon promiscuus]